MLPLASDEIRAKFLQFYADRGHTVLPSASLIPEDPTVLLTIAGMLPFKPIFLGQQEAPVPRATTAQKCIRTNDIENVGRTARHHTFFEMLGNFSFGDYFKKEAIAWGWELVTGVFGIPPERLAVSVYHTDDEAYEIWQKNVGVPSARICRMGDDNFWAAGPTGPCGPCSEIYYDFHPERGNETIDLEDDRRFLEIYNLVFMELNRDAAGQLTPLAKQNIDTGMGLERMAQVLQGVPNNYETDGLLPLLQQTAVLAGRDYHRSDAATQRSLKTVGDHIRAVTHLVADGVTAANVGRGYVLRRLLRRVVRHGRLVGIDGPFAAAVAQTAIALGEKAYPNLRERESVILAEIEREETRFLQTLDRGEKLLAEILDRPETQQTQRIAGTDVFVLYDTYGFPWELTAEIAEEQGLTVDLAGFQAEMAAQQERAKAARVAVDVTGKVAWSTLAKDNEATVFVGYHDLIAEGMVVAIAPIPAPRIQFLLDRTPFYGESGGQVGDRGYVTNGETLVRVDDVQKDGSYFVHIGEIIRGELHVGDRVTARVSTPERRRTQAHHSATHLLQAALKSLVDPSIGQAGSLVDSDRLRFDFHWSRPLTAAEVAAVEQQVNQWVMDGHRAIVAVMPMAEAKAKGAIAMFGEKYGAQVRVVDFPGVSMELCGGTHVANTAEIGPFKILAETGISAGVRRIEAVAGQALLDYLKVRDDVTKALGDRFKAKPEEIVDRVTALQEDLKQARKEIEKLKQELALQQLAGLAAQAETVGEFAVVVQQVAGVDGSTLALLAEKLLERLGNHSAVVLGAIPEPDKVSLAVAFSKEANKKGLQAGKFIAPLAQRCGGGGGGRPNLAQAGGRHPASLPAALAEAQAQLRQSLI
ncbi:MAG: alanine--tRNA ligase [Pseudanabaenaceae cyanobacterium]